MAISARVAKILKGGRIAHFAFNISASSGAGEACHISVNSNDTRMLLDMYVIVSDVKFMFHRYCIESLDRTLTNIMPNTNPFRGRALLRVGNFQQFLPVVPSSSRAQNVNASKKSSFLYNSF